MHGTIFLKTIVPRTITKYINEPYADVFVKVYQLDTFGLRYFNAFEKRLDSNGAYAAVIPKFVIQFMKYDSPIINGDSPFSRDFAYIDNIL